MNVASVPPRFGRLASLAGQLGALAEVHGQAHPATVVLGQCALADLVDEASRLGVLHWTQIRVMSQALVFLENCLRLWHPPEVERNMLLVLADMASNLLDTLARDESRGCGAAA